MLLLWDYSETNQRFYYVHTVYTLCWKSDQPSARQKKKNKNFFIIIEPINLTSSRVTCISHTIIKCVQPASLYF